MKQPENETTIIEAVKPSLLRRYFYEYAILGLTGSVIFLFLSINDLNKFIRDNLLQQKIEVVKAIEQNTEALKQFNNIQKRNTNENGH